MNTISDAFAAQKRTEAVLRETAADAAPPQELRGRVLLPDLIKAGAAQIIAWHHFCLFGPMSDAAWWYAPALFKWLANNGKLSVQCFLVMGGFMAAAALLPGGSKPWTAPRLAEWPGIVWRRYKRLAKVYFIGLAAAIVCAYIARAMVEEPSTPAAPDLYAIVAHLFFAQDVLGVPALTAGAWYVAIDLQLYALLALLCVLSAGIASGRSVRYIALGLVVCLGLSSLLLFNRDHDLEIWGIYFFGSYSLGIAAHWVSRLSGLRKRVWLCVMMAACVTALLVEWRSRIAVSTLTACALVLFGTYRTAAKNWFVSLVGYLSRISFPLFVLHYPVLMLVGAIVGANWDDDPAANMTGLLVAWSLAMAAATAVAAWFDPVASRGNAPVLTRWLRTAGLAQI
ncbi:MAG TPA: acyltransferase family protein [Burkholderiaceae bacterium]